MIVALFITTDFLLTWLRPEGSLLLTPHLAAGLAGAMARKSTIPPVDTERGQSQGPPSPIRPGPSRRMRLKPKVTYTDMDDDKPPALTDSEAESDHEDDSADHEDHGDEDANDKAEYLGKDTIVAKDTAKKYPKSEIIAQLHKQLEDWVKNESIIPTRKQMFWTSKMQAKRWHLKSCNRPELLGMACSQKDDL